MAILTEREAREAATNYGVNIRKSADSILREEASTSRTSFDIFLSHSRLDSDVILGTKVILERTGQSVYVDWIDDPQLDRSRVTSATAAKLRIRMRQSRSLFYAHSMNATKSRWMPWELGYFDGFNGNVAILPIAGGVTPINLKGEEYVDLYPYVDVSAPGPLTSRRALWIHRDNTTYTSFAKWRDGSDKLRP